MCKPSDSLVMAGYFIFVLTEFCADSNLHKNGGIDYPVPYLLSSDMILDANCNILLCFLMNVFVLFGGVCSAMKYRVLVVAEGKRFGLSTSSLYLDLAGDFRESERIEIPKGELETTLEVGYV